MVLYRVFVTMKLLTRIESLNIKSKSLNYTLRGKQSKWKVCLIVHFHNSKVAPWFCNLQKEVYRKIFRGSVITAITAETKMKLCKVRRIFLFKVVGRFYLVRLQPCTGQKQVSILVFGHHMQRKLRLNL